MGFSPRRTCARVCAPHSLRLASVALIVLAYLRRAWLSKQEPEKQNTADRMGGGDKPGEAADEFIPSRRCVLRWRRKP